MARKKQKKVRIKAEKRERKQRIFAYIGRFVFLVCLLLGARWFVEMIREPRQAHLEDIIVPEWIEQDFIRENPYSRPGTELKRVNSIVIHYVANPETTADNNRDFFDGLADQKGSDKETVSSHFIVGLDGEILQCIPLEEIAYTSNHRNGDTISIECCHPDWSGEFTDATYDSVVELTAWLCQELNLNEEQVIRHYDITGKLCPKYFVVNEDAWLQFKNDVKEVLSR